MSLRTDQLRACLEKVPLSIFVAALALNAGWPGRAFSATIILYVVRRERPRYTRAISG